MAEQFTIRQVTFADAPIIVAHRRAMFYDIGHTDNDVLNTMDAAFRAWLDPKLAAGEYIGWFAIAENGEVAAGAGLRMLEWAPGPTDFSTERAYIQDVYTHPAYRQRGLARLLMSTILDWCRECKIQTVVLHASKAGRPIYETLGFEGTNEMRIDLSRSAPRR